MDTRLPDDVAMLEEAARLRFRRLGGVHAARRAEADPTERDQAREALRELGASELDVRADDDQLLAAAALCRAAGSVVLPWPLIGELLRVDGHYLALMDDGCVRVDHGTLDVPWIGATPAGSAWRLRSARTGLTGRLGPFVATAELGDPVEGGVGTDDVARYLVLQAWTILGALESSVAGVVEHVRTRHQFGRPLAEFQVIRFTLADVEVAVRGLQQLAKLTVWRRGRSDARERLADAIGLRLQAAETAVAALRAAHQFYGALGFCDETDLSVIDRHLQPVLRYPLSGERLAQALVPFVQDGVFTARIA